MKPSRAKTQPPAQSSVPPPPAPPPRNLATLWGAVFVRHLADLGLEHAVISPGSRSTPLAFALANEPRIRATPALDERTGAFFALGLAKATRRPVLALCTSGTAAANFLPAAVEAWHSQTPLLLVTADRPPEQHDCGAGQTIEQNGIFGRHVLFSAQTPLPAADRSAFAKLRDVLTEAWRSACGCDPQGAFAPRGPAHLNAPLREPLAPDEAEADFDAPAALAAAAPTENVRPISPPAASAEGVRRTFANLREWLRKHVAGGGGAGASGVKGVIVAGDANPADPDAYCAAAVELARLLNWQILADATNPLRHRAGGALLADGSPAVVADYGRRLAGGAAGNAATGAAGDAAFAAWTPAAVVQFGQLQTSKVLRRWLARKPLPTCLFSRGGRNLNPLRPYHPVNIRAEFTLEDLREWSTSGTTGATAITTGAAACPPHSSRSEAALSALCPLPLSLCPTPHSLISALAARLPDDAAVIFANSLTVRAAETHWPATATRRLVFSNRGANGIDGTLGTALGIAGGVAPRPAFLLTGDLAFLHDTNALLLAPELVAAGGSLTVIVVNNAGGGIFRNLAVARANPHFERFWLTPQRVDIGRLCAAYGVAHREWETGNGERIENVEAELLQPPPRGLRVLEIKVPPVASRADG
ncbi:MAG: 2-succinyl-5-enolpyruvyl-6-hydroxy-3-cyclohexene-1-carboxylic-acid synthase [Puniceicoccales bacterium]|nr:2-succinyl-5-enolpyruvyl-6-hydroxy-3-cyclohexene-1-carboxylic-acid synthase [Puniceicoccales bacterium]